MASVPHAKPRSTVLQDYFKAAPVISTSTQCVLRLRLSFSVRVPFLAMPPCADRVVFDRDECMGGTVELSAACSTLGIIPAKQKTEAKQKTAKRVKKGSTPASEKHEGQAEAPSFSKSGRLLKKKQAY